MFSCLRSISPNLRLALALVYFCMSSLLYANEISQGQTVTYLKPADFKYVPKIIIYELEQLGCHIPQANVYGQGKQWPHNIVRGEFAQKGQEDWVALCSNNQQSAIVFFWGGSARCDSKLAMGNDVDWLQRSTGGEQIYSRELKPVNDEYITPLFEYADELSHIDVEHDGLNEIFHEKSSLIHYCYQGQWYQAIDE